MNKRTVSALLAVTAATACADVTGTAGGLTPEEMAQLSDAVVTSTFDATSAVATEASVTDLSGDGLAADLTSTTTFTRTFDCPLGGQVITEGTRERVVDWDEGTGTMDLSLVRTHEQCARPIRRSGDGVSVTVTLDGAPNVAVEAHHEWAWRERHGLQTMTMEGAVDWVTDDDRSGTCVIDIEASFDPDTHTRTVTGTFCDREIDRTTTWQSDGMNHHGGQHGGMGG